MLEHLRRCSRALGLGQDNVLEPSTQVLQNTVLGREWPIISSEAFFGYATEGRGRQAR